VRVNGAQDGSSVLDGVVTFAPGAENAELANVDVTVSAVGSAAAAVNVFANGVKLRNVDVTTSAAAGNLVWVTGDNFKAEGGVYDGQGVTNVGFFLGNTEADPNTRTTNDQRDLSVRRTEVTGVTAAVVVQSSSALENLDVSENQLDTTFFVGDYDCVVWLTGSSDASTIDNFSFNRNTVTDTAGNFALALNTGTFTNFKVRDNVFDGTNVGATGSDSSFLWVVDLDGEDWTFEGNQVWTTYPSYVESKFLEKVRFRRNSFVHTAEENSWVFSGDSAADVYISDFEFVDNKVWLNGGSGVGVWDQPHVVDNVVIRNNELYNTYTDD